MDLIKRRREEGILYVIETYGGLLSAIVRKCLFTAPDRPINGKHPTRGVEAVRSQNEKSGYMQNEEVIDDGRLNMDTETVTMTLYAAALPEGDGRISNDYVQIGETFELEI